MDFIEAKEVKQIADAVNKTVEETELDSLLRLVIDEAYKGKYSFSGSGDICEKNKVKLKELGFSVEIGGRMNEIDYCISWDKIDVKETVSTGKCFYDKPKFDMVKYKTFVNGLINKYEIVCWGGVGCKHWSTDFTDVVVVFEGGVRGPADWYYLNDDNRWAHGGYTAYKETYSDDEFITMIEETIETNKKNGY